MNKNIMYRSESFSGSGVYEVKKVIEFEICTLGNTDILDYCLEHYNLTPTLRESLSELMDFIEKDDVIIEDLDDPTKIDYTYYLIDRLVDEISMLVGHPIKYAIWLADLDIVREIYSDSDDDIEAYEISDVVLSDLGEDGKLFGYETFPQSMELGELVEDE